MNIITDKAREKAIEVLKSCSRPTGFYASGLPGGYEALWARDSMTCSLGASLIGEEFKEDFRKSIETLAKNQTELGLIPNCVGSFNIERNSDVTFNSVDAPLWYAIGQQVFAKAYNDDSLLKKYDKSIKAALTWVRYQDPNNDGLIVQQPTNDWMDAFPHKYGRVMHDQALHYAALKLNGQTGRAEHLKLVLNGETEAYLSLYDKKLGYYLPWAWKDHDGDREQEEWFDSTANLLAIITGLATPKIAKSILNYIEKEKVNRPYGCKAIWPPIKKGDKAWKSYFEKCDARTPYQYLNGGVWPWIGGLYVSALVKVGDFKKAAKELELLAEGNLQVIKIPGHPEYMAEVATNNKMSKEDLTKLRQKEFNEWFDGKTGKPKGEPYQAWTAGTYLYALECVKQKKVLFF